jgi:hypothetical protein
LGAPPPTVRVTFNDGLVSLTAADATAAQILAEWSRVGGTRIVNADRIAGPPLKLELTGVLEMDALEVLLRTTGGFIAAARSPGPSKNSPQLSGLEQITVLPFKSQPAIPPPAQDVPVTAPEATPTPPTPAPIFDASGARRLIGSDGQPVPDDQDGAPPAPQNPSR